MSLKIISYTTTWSQKGNISLYSAAAPTFYSWELCSIEWMFLRRCWTAAPGRAEQPVPTRRTPHHLTARTPPLTRANTCGDCAIRSLLQLGQGRLNSTKNQSKEKIPPDLGQSGDDVQINFWMTFRQNLRWNSVPKVSNIYFVHHPLLKDFRITSDSYQNKG